jgi:hypothetical protein
MINFNFRRVLRTALITVAIVLLGPAHTSATSIDVRPEMKLPTVKPDDFKIGRYWTWDYVEASGNIYSSERYVVVGHADNMVWLEMSTQLPHQVGFNAHHRLQVNVQDCLRAYRNPNQKIGWSFRMFQLENGSWQETGVGKTLAFEEKFNCNPFLFTDAFANFLTVEKKIGGEEVFQQRLWRRLDSTWFSEGGPDAGIAFMKTFDAEQPKAYTMKRRAE